MTPLHIDDSFMPGAGDTHNAPLDGHSLLAQLGREVAGRLSPALERVTSLGATGRIDRQSLRALHDEVDHARRNGLRGQQLARLAQGRVAVVPTRLDMMALLSDALTQRAQEMEVRGLSLRTKLAAAEVVSDATLLRALLQAALDWSFEHAAGRIDLQLEQRDWPTHACLRCAFEVRSAAPEPHTQAMAAATQGGAALDTMSWRLLGQTALTLGLSLRRREERGRTELVLDFPPSPVTALSPDALLPAPSHAPPAHAGNAAPPTFAVALDDVQPAASNFAAQAGAATTPTAPAAPTAPFGSKASASARQKKQDAERDGPAYAATMRPLAGLHVLVLAARRDVRAQVREALRDMDLLIDFVTSVAEARLFCADAIPQAVVYEAAQDTADFQRLCDTLLQQRPALGLVQIAEQGRSFDVVSLGGRDVASVGRDGLRESLPAALMFELFRGS